MGYCVCDSFFINSTGKIAEQHIIIIIRAGLYDGPFFQFADAWISYVTIRYVNDNFIEDFESRFSNVLIEGTVL